VLACSEGVTGVEAEAGTELGDGVPQPGEVVELAGTGVVAARGVLDQDRQWVGRALERLAPAVEALRRVLVLADVATVHDQPAGADGGGRLGVLVDDLAAGDPYPIVAARDVDQVGRVDVDHRVA